MIFFWLLILPFVLGSGLRDRGTCRIIALEGGGTKGAYQAGAFEAMVDLMPAAEVQYDVVTGNSGNHTTNLGASVGALNGLMIASHAKGEERRASQRLTELWRNIRREDILVNWGFPGPLQGLFSKPSFFDNSPELEFVERKFREVGGKVRRHFTFGIVDAQTGAYIAKNQDTNGSLIPHYIVASSSVPGIFRYILEGSHVLIDGGTINNLNLRGGIEECHKIVDNDSKITIDVIMTNPRTLPGITIM